MTNHVTTTGFFRELRELASAALTRDPKSNITVDAYSLLLLFWRLDEAEERLGEAAREIEKLKHEAWVAGNGPWEEHADRLMNWMRDREMEVDE